MASPDVQHETVLEAGSVKSRLAKLYAEALLLTAIKQNRVEEAGSELTSFITEVLDKDRVVEAFLSSPVIGKKVKTTALEAALPGHVSEILRGLFAVLTRNGRLDLLRGISAAYNQILDERAGRVPVKVTTATELTEAQRTTLLDTLSRMLKQQPVLHVRVDPDLLGGMIIQVGDRVIDTSARTRLQTLRTLLLDRASDYVTGN
ncbi:MAG: ATP synthase F1 subunit delta [Planctomycetia bacterium]|nr:ATP synthase F1 subunit delta [Planctomycetia bacterium]